MTKDDKTDKINNSIFEVAREDASNIMLSLNDKKNKTKF